VSPDQPGEHCATQLHQHLCNNKPGRSVPATGIRSIPANLQPIGKHAGCESLGLEPQYEVEIPRAHRLGLPCGPVWPAKQVSGVFRGATEAGEDVSRAHGQSSSLGT
jgi:hypothetical protein